MIYAITIFLVAVLVVLFVRKKDEETREDTIDRAVLPDRTVIHNPDWEGSATCLLATYAHSRDNQNADEETRARGEAGYNHYKDYAFPKDKFNVENAISHWASNKSIPNKIWPDCYPKAK